MISSDDNKLTMMLSEKSDFQASNWICPNFTWYWKLGQTSDGKIRLTVKNGHIQHEFFPREGYALQHFIGKFSAE